MSSRFIGGQETPKLSSLSQDLEKILTRMYKGKIMFERDSQGNINRVNVGYTNSRTLNSILCSNSIHLKLSESPISKVKTVDIDSRISSPCTRQLSNYVERILAKRGYDSQRQYGLDEEILPDEFREVDYLKHSSKAA